MEVMEKMVKMGVMAMMEKLVMMALQVKRII